MRRGAARSTNAVHRVLSVLPHSEALSTTITITYSDATNAAPLFRRSALPSTFQGVWGGITDSRISNSDGTKATTAHHVADAAKREAVSAVLVIGRAW